MARRSRKLYPKSPEERERVRETFERRYGPTGGRTGKGGDYIYGATIAKVREEQAENGTRGREEWIRPHEAVSDEGTRFHVKGHAMRVPRRSHDPHHSHGPGHHSGCRRGGHCFHVHGGGRRRRRARRGRRTTR